MGLPPAVITAGLNVFGNLLGGLFGRKSAKKQQAAEWAREDNKLQRLVVDAGKAGISPLAALGSSAASYQAPTIQMPDLGSAVGEGIGTIADALSPETRAREARAAELGDLELRRARAETAYAESTATQSTFNARAAMAAPLSNSRRSFGLGGLNPIQQIQVGGKIIPTANASNAEDVETRYGDLIQSVYGTGLLAYDGVNLAKKGIDKLRGFDPETAPMPKKRDYSYKKTEKPTSKRAEAKGHWEMRGTSKSGGRKVWVLD